MIFFLIYDFNTILFKKINLYKEKVSITNKILRILIVYVSLRNEYSENIY